MFGSSFGFYYLFFLFGSIIYVVWKLKSCLLGLRCSTASLSLLRFSWTLEFKGVIFYPVDNIYSWKYVCMYVCLICMKKIERAFSRSWEAFSSCCSFRSEDHSFLDVLCSTLFSDSACSVPFHYHIHLFSCQKKGL